MEYGMQLSFYGEVFSKKKSKTHASCRLLVCCSAQLLLFPQLQSSLQENKIQCMESKPQGARINIGFITNPLSKTL